MLIEYVKNGRRRNVTAAVAKVLVGRNLARPVEEGDAESSAPAPAPATAAQTYGTRMMQAAPVDAAPYGYKADGTPRKRPAPAARASKAQD